jgi:hypothetical protein
MTASKEVDMRTLPETRATGSIHPAQSRNALLVTALALAPMGAVLILAAILTPQPAKGTLVSLGIGAELLATLAAVTGWIPGHGNRYAFRPVSALGWSALTLLTLGVVLVLGAGWFDGSTHPGSHVRAALVLLGLLSAMASAAVTLVAVFRRGERSLPVIGVTLFGGFVSFMFLVAGLVA